MPFRVCGSCTPESISTDGALEVPQVLRVCAHILSRDICLYPLPLNQTDSKGSFCILRWMSQESAKDLTHVTCILRIN